MRSWVPISGWKATVVRLEKGVKWRQSPIGHWPASLAKSMSSGLSKRPCSVSKIKVENSHWSVFHTHVNMDTSQTDRYTHTQTDTYTQTQMHTHNFHLGSASTTDRIWIYISCFRDNELFTYMLQCPFGLYMKQTNKNPFGSKKKISLISEFTLYLIYSWGGHWISNPPASASWVLLGLQVWLTMPSWKSSL